MHPAVQVVFVLVLAIGISGAGTGHLIAGAAALLAAMLVTGAMPVREVARGLLRLKYLYLAILVMYGWFHPGAALVPQAGAWSPSLPGLLEGLHRAAVLALMLAGVIWMMHCLGRERLLAALIYLCAPLDRLGFPSQRFALRLVLALTLLPRFESMVRRRGMEGDTPASDAERSAATGASTAWPSGVRATAARVVSMWRETVDMAESEPPGSVCVPRLTRPLWWQWCPPALLAALLWAV